MPARRRLAPVAALVVAVVAPAVSLPALAQVSSPAAIALTPDCGAPSPGSPYPVRVDGSNFNPATAVLVTFDSARGGTPESFQSRTDGFGRFSLTIAPQRRPEGEYQVRGDDLRQREATASFRIPCSRPPDVSVTTASTVPAPDVTVTTAGTTVSSNAPHTPPPVLRTDPPLGPPGFVTAAVGSGFPPNAPVALGWFPGITALPLVPVVADATGAFRAQVLVMRRDQIGPRRLTATPADGVAFPTVSAQFLVVPGTLQPGEFKDRR